MKAKNSGVAVTGGAGFIGSHLCQKLVEEGRDVVCIDNLYTGKEENIKPLLKNPNFKLIKCDVRDLDKLRQVFNQGSIKMVYHGAAVVGVRRTLDNPEEVLSVNISGTVNVLKAALECGCQKVVNISSSEVYGNPAEIPEREDSPKNVELPYAMTKLLGEKYSEIYHQKYGLKTTSLRLFNVYGPRQNSTPYGFVVGIFANRILQDKPPIIYGDGFQTRDFNYIEDCIETITLAGEKSAADGKVLNVAAGQPITILDLAELIIELCGKKLKPLFEPAREFEIRHRFADISRVRTTLGYQPRRDIREGLRLTIDWYKENLLEADEL